jgi:cysteine-rich repeat protein
VLVLATFVLAPGDPARSAPARPRPSDGPPDLVEKAYSAAEEKRYCDAIPLFLALHERAPQAKHLYRAAEVALAAGDRRLALDLYRSVLAAYPTFEKKKVVEERARTIEATMKTDGPGATCPDPPSICGDWIVRPGEQCDDGNLIDGDGCDSNCLLTGCGNGIVTAPEECDDGNVLDGDGCDGNCVRSACGNGIVAGTEECDDGNDIDGDGCDRNCTRSRCGNGIVAGDEQCDDGNTVSGDGCDRNCMISACGNGALQPGEECDDGNDFDGDGCDRGCVATRCGNGVVSPGESCDDGNDVDGDGCDHNCTPTRCGNGVRTEGEECDDGNNLDGDGCSSDCRDVAGGRLWAGGLTFAGSALAITGVALGIGGALPLVEHAQKSNEIAELEDRAAATPRDSLEQARLLQSQLEATNRRWFDVGVPLVAAAGAALLVGAGLSGLGLFLWMSDEPPSATDADDGLEERVP